MSLTKKDFLYDLITQCLENDVELKFLKPDNIEGASGSFIGEEDECELCCILDKDNWLEILVHESCHMDQYLEESPLWFHDLHEFNIWEVNKFIESDIKLRAFKAVTELEIDCDKRSLKKIKKYNLDIDIPKYIQKSNCYHQSYYYFHKFDIFYDFENIPFENKELIEMYDNKKILDIDEIWCESEKLEYFLVRNNVKL